MRRTARHLRRWVAGPVTWLLSRTGLRWRITLGFAVGAALLSLVLAGITYGLTRENVVNQGESNARSLTTGNAQTVRGAIGGDQPVDDPLQNVRRPPGRGGPMLWSNGTWSVDAGVLTVAALPDSLRSAVIEERLPARMRFSFDGQTYLVVGLPLEDVEGDAQAAYFQVVPMDDVERALESLTIALVAAVIVTTLAGAFMGWVGARRVLRPLDSIRKAARRLARGDLETQVDAGTDPDLATLATAFNNMVSALRERIEQDARFASNVTHELRSPLTTLSASLEVLENTRDGMPDRAQTAVDLLVADVTRFTQLIEDLLEMSRLDAGVANVEPDTVLIVELVMVAVDEQSDRDIPVHVAGDLAGVVVNVDKRRLQRAIANLLDNAAKYGSGAELVEVRAVGEMVQVAVEDGGPGVAEKDRQRIFDRFSRGWVEGDRAGRKGVGLGLSIVAEHIRIHGGEVWVESRPSGEQGARFVFTLPMDTSDHPELHSEDLSDVHEPAADQLADPDLAERDPLDA